MTNRHGWRRSCQSAERELLSFLQRPVSVPLRGRFAGRRLHHRPSPRHDLTSIEPKPPTGSSSGDTFLRGRPRGVGAYCPKRLMAEMAPVAPGASSRRRGEARCAQGWWQWPLWSRLASSGRSRRCPSGCLCRARKWARSRCLPSNSSFGWWKKRPQDDRERAETLLTVLPVLGENWDRTVLTAHDLMVCSPNL